MLNFLKNRYYRLKYRNSQGASIAFIDQDKKKKAEFDSAVERLAEKVEPCEMSIAEVFDYAAQKYGAVAYELGETELSMEKANIIMSFFPHWLENKAYVRKDNEKAPSRREFLAENDNFMLRLSEARSFPMEKTGFSFSACRFLYITSSGAKATFKIKAEEKTGQVTIGSSADRILTDEENREIRLVHLGLDKFRGVSREDIQNRTPRFLGYVHTLLELEKEK